MKKLIITLCIIIVPFVISSESLAGNVPTPTEAPEGVTIISADDMKTLVGQNNVHVFDMRKALNFGKGHLPGAVSIPYKWTKKGHPAERTGQYDMTKLPSDKKAKVIFHSDGPNGWKSYYASKAAAESGYENVFWMRDGFATWTEKGYSVEH